MRIIYICYTAQRNKLDKTPPHLFARVVRYRLSPNGENKRVQQVRFKTRALISVKVGQPRCCLWGGGSLCDDDHARLARAAAENSPLLQVLQLYGKAPGKGTKPLMLPWSFRKTQKFLNTEHRQAKVWRVFYIFTIPWWPDLMWLFSWDSWANTSSHRSHLWSVSVCDNAWFSRFCSVWKLKMGGGGGKKN